MLWLDAMIRVSVVIKVAVILGVVLSLRIFFIDKWVINDASVFGVIGQGLVNGKVLYRDFWDNKPPVIYFVFALSYFLFGNNFRSIAIFEITYLLGISCLFWRIVKVKFKSDIVFIGTAIFATYISSMVVSGTAGMIETYLLLPALITLYFMVNQENINVTAYIGLGMSCAMGMMTKQTSLVLVIISAILGWLAYKKYGFHAIINIILGAILMSLPLIIYLVHYSTVGDFWSQTIAFSKFYVTNKLSVVAYLREAYNSLFLLKYPLLLLLGLYAVLLKYKQKTVVICSLWIALELVQIVMTGHFYNHYLIVSLVPLSYLSLLSLEKIYRDNTILNFYLISILGLLILSPLIYSQSFLQTRDNTENKYEVLGDILLKNGYVGGQTIYTFNDWPHLNYFLGAKTVGKYIYPVPLTTNGYLNINQVTAEISTLNQKEPDFVILNSDLSYNQSMDTNLIKKSLMTLLKDKYVAVAQINNYQVYKKK